MRVLIDTNILLRAVQPSHAQNRTARMALLALHRKGDTMCLTLRNLTEFLERVRGVQVHDTQLVMKAYSIPADCEIVTFNIGDFARFSDIEVIHPHSYAQGRQ